MNLGGGQVHHSCVVPIGYDYMYMLCATFAQAGILEKFHGSWL